MSVIERFEQLYTPPNPEYRAIVEALALPRTSRVLDIGCGGAGGRQTIAHLVELFDGPVIGVERIGTRAAEVAAAFGDRASVQTVDAIYWEDQPYDLISVQLDIAGTVDTLTVIVPEVLSRLLKPDGYALLQLATKSRVDGDKPAGVSETTFNVLDPFFEENFGSLLPPLNAIIDPLSAMGFEPTGLFPVNPARRSGSATGDPLPSISTPNWQSVGIMSWLLLRRRQPAASRAGMLSSPFKARRPDTFPADRIVAWLERLRREATAFHLPETYFPQLKSASSPDSARRPASLLKHDIHHDFRRVVRLAEMEAGRGLFGVYFMMPKHELNEGFYAVDYTWSSLRNLQEMGHVIGMHIDPFDLIVKYGNLYDGIGDSLERFCRAGLKVTVGNSHGNTKFSNTMIHPAAFFVDAGARPKQSTDAVFGRHVGAYSLATLGERFGIVHWLDSVPRERGATCGDVYYVSDNSKRIVISGRAGAIAQSAEFDLTDDFIEESIEALRHHDSLFLLHPQFYE